jgi:hypothetical protein
MEVNKNMVYITTKLKTPSDEFEEEEAYGNDGIHVEISPKKVGGKAVKRNAASAKSPMSLHKKRKTTTMNTVTSSILDGITDAIKGKEEKKVSWKLKEIEETQKLKEAEHEQTRQFKEAEHKLKEREVLVKETEVAVQKLKVEGELEKIKSEAELIQEQKKTVIQEQMTKLLMDCKELLELGVSKEDVDLMLSLK